MEIEAPGRGFCQGLKLACALEMYYNVFIEYC